MQYGVAGRRRDGIIALYHPLLPAPSSGHSQGRGEKDRVMLCSSSSSLSLGAILGAVSCQAEFRATPRLLLSHGGLKWPALNTHSGPALAIRTSDFGRTKILHATCVIIRVLNNMVHIVWQFFLFLCWQKAAN